MSLQDLLAKCKSDNVFVLALLGFVAIGSFGLGRLSRLNELRPAVTIEAPRAVAENIRGDTSLALEGSTEQGSASDGEVVASKSGSKYHFPWCSGAKSIADANKIWFNSAVAARAAGYTAAANCKGLK